MKKSISMLLLLLLLLLPCLSFAAEYAVVTSGRLNLRARASAASASLGRYAAGSWVRLEGSQAGGWYAVATMDGKHGYMMGSYLTRRSTPGGRATVRYAQGGYVNLRSGPSLETPAIIQVRSGTHVSILGSTWNWYHVSLTQNGQPYTGYIHDSLVDVGTGSAVVTTRNGGKVNVRSGPSFSYGSLGSLATGTRVTVLLKGTGWTWIQSSGMNGFMSNSYLSDSGYTPVTPTAPPSPSGGSVAWVNNPLSTQVLNLRESPSQNSRSLRQYRNGKQVSVVSYGPVWCQVYVDGLMGYMMTRYLRFSGFAPTTAPFYGMESYGAESYGMESYGTESYFDPYAYSAPKSMPTATPKPIVEYLTPAPKSGNPGEPQAGDYVKLAPAAGGGSTINVYRDAKLTTLLGTYENAKEVRMLKYGENVCMVLIDGGVGYVSTWNINY